MKIKIIQLPVKTFTVNSDAVLAEQGVKQTQEQQAKMTNVESYVRMYVTERNLLILYTCVNHAAVSRC